MYKRIPLTGYFIWQMKEIVMTKTWKIWNQILVYTCIFKSVQTSSHESGNPWCLCTICTKTGIYIILKTLKFLNNIQVIIQISSLGVLQLRSNPQTLLTNAATVPVSQGTQLFALKLSM